MSVYSLYIHIPFCQRRCGYCDFNTYAGHNAQIPEYVDALCREIWLASCSGAVKLPVHTIFFGGGTPSLLTASQVAEILNKIRGCYHVHPDAEITLEANPGTLTRQSLEGMRAAGVNRISLGMQSNHPDDLQLLDRRHHPADVTQAVSWARQAGIENISLDLIFGIPGQPLERWQQSVEAALELSPEHLSLYALTVEQGTPLSRWVGHGLIPAPDDDLAADQYEWSMTRLENAGYEQYEISNWAKILPDRSLMSRHNLQYWLSEPYIGLGAGAHGYAAGWRTANALRISDYIHRVVHGDEENFPFSPANVHRKKIGARAAMQEMMMVGLRLTGHGVRTADFQRKFGCDVRDVFGNEIKKLVEQGLLEWSEGQSCLRLTRRGRLLGNQVFLEFVG